MLQRVSDMRSCSFVKFQALIAMLEHLKCDELTIALWWLLPKFNVFDHKEKVAEIFWGAPPSLRSRPRPHKALHKRYWAV